MKTARFTFIILLGLMLVRCSNNSDPSATSTVSLKLSATTAAGKSSFGGRTLASVSLTDVRVNIREIEFEFDHEDENFKKDSCFNENSYHNQMGMGGNHKGDDDNEAKLKGPYIIDLMNAGSFVDQLVTTVEIPNAQYEKVKFKLSPSTEPGDMQGKSVLVTGTVGSTPFFFWHKAKVKFGIKFSDNTSLAANGEAVTLAIQLELDKVLSVVNGGVDLSKAIDGNNDGTITIDPNNSDGNEDLANDIMKLLTRHVRCEKKKD